jgi:carboxyl-terminal processing protease
VLTIRRISVVFCALLFVGGLFSAHGLADTSSAPETTPQEDYYELYKVLVDTIDQVERNYVKQLSRRELIEAAIEGVLDKLDPYSAYISPERLEHFRTTMESEFGGIGIQISIQADVLTIVSPLVGTPAYRAGLMAGDRVVEINGESTEGLKLDEAVRRLKGEAGTKVTLTVVHPGETEPEKVEITRENIHIDTVLGDHRKKDDAWEFMLRPDQGIGYVRLTAFSRDTARELRKTLEQLQSEGLRGLVLDLRFNPGGLLRSAVEISDMFVSEGRIVSTEGRNTPVQIWEAQKSGTFEGFPMVVLINRYSASASEIVSACLQDQDRAVIIGERTWGKGSVQNLIELEDGRSALKLTTASYRRPNGKNIDRGSSESEDEWGVRPDEGFEIRLSDEEMQRLVTDRRQRDVVRPNHGEQPDRDDADAEPDETSAEEPAGQKDTEEKPEKTAVVDRQLQSAVEHLSGRLAQAQ